MFAKMKNVFVDLPRKTNRFWLHEYFCVALLSLIYVLPIKSYFFSPPLLQNASARSGNIELVWSKSRKRVDKVYVRLPREGGGGYEADFATINTGDFSHRFVLSYGEPIDLSLSGQHGTAWVHKNAGLIQLEVGGSLLFSYDEYKQIVDRTRCLNGWLSLIPTSLLMYVLVRNVVRYRIYTNNLLSE